MKDIIKKNKLDLTYNKYSQFFNTTIIIFSTITIGILIALLTEQIKIGKNIPFIFIALLFITILIFSIYSLIKFHNEMERIIKKIDKLKV